MPSIAGIFNAADAVLGRKSRQNVDCQHALMSSHPLASITRVEKSSLKINNRSEDKMDTAPQGLSCAGYGASMLVTASFGLHCATAAIEHIVRRG